MAFTLDLHDSEILDAAAAGDALRVRLAAASVRDAEGRRGWIPSVQLVLAGAIGADDLAHAVGKIAGGQLRHDGQDVRLPPLPFTLDGPVELELRLANGGTLALRARGLAATVDADAPFTEDLSC